jgi:glycosyltransferase involved in cell wall biosynthesis
LSGRRPKLCIVQFNASTYLTRVDRAARTLANAGWEVVLLGLQDEGTAAFEQRDGYVVKRVPIRMRRFTRRFGLKYLRFIEGVWRMLSAARRERADVYDARDAYPLFVCAAAARLRGALYVYDSDELATGRNWRVAANPLFSWAIRRYEGHYARRADAVITSDEGRADVIERLYSIPRPAVVRNVPERMPDIQPDLEWRARAIGDRRYLLLYQGVLIPNRGLRELVLAMRSLPDCRLALVGYGSLAEELRALIMSEGLSEAAEVFDPVPFDVLIRYTAAADASVIPIVGSCLSYRTAAPNKLFESMMAGVPVVASDLPGMAPIVREERVGTLIADPTDPASIAEAVRELLDGDEPLSEIGRRARQAALARHNWDIDARVLLDVFEGLRGKLDLTR